MAHSQTTIHIHPLAPAKVEVGVACNGCGVCCLFAPCPLGILLSRRRSGACAALRWDDASVRYRCGAIVAPQEVLTQAMPRGLQGLVPLLAPALRRLGLRWIAAGIGCDSDLEVGPSISLHGQSSVDADTASTTMATSDLYTPNSSRTEVRHPPK